MFIIYISLFFSLHTSSILVVLDICARFRQFSMSLENLARRRHARPRRPDHLPIRDQGLQGAFRSFPFLAYLSTPILFSPSLYFVVLIINMSFPSLASCPLSSYLSSFASSSLPNHFPKPSNNLNKIIPNSGIDRLSSSVLFFRFTSPLPSL